MIGQARGIVYRKGGALTEKLTWQLRKDEKGDSYGRKSKQGISS